MTKERLKRPRLRLFVALELPTRVRAGLARWGAAELTDPALRPVAPEALHVTLAFLGWRWERDVRGAAEILHALPRDPIRLALAPEPVAIPTRGREKRLFAVEAVSPAAAELQAELERELVAAGLYEPEKRPFWSHVTVARVRREKGGRKRHRAVERPPGPLPAELCRPCFGVRVTLYRSALRPAGAEYTPLAQVELPES